MERVYESYNRFLGGVKYLCSIPVKYYKVTFTIQGIGIIALIISAIVKAS